MATSALPHSPARYLSLRWKALIALSVVLILVNASLAWLAYHQSADQFEQQQAQVRDQQARQLQALLEDGYQQMARLASIVPLLGVAPSEPHLEARLQGALDQNSGFMLDLEWDIRSVHWIRPEARPLLLWPDQAPTLPGELSEELQNAPEQTAKLLSCKPDCYQYLASPLLWRGSSHGALVLSRSVADALLTFHGLTGANVALMVNHAGAPRFPVITYREQIEPLLRQVPPESWAAPGNTHVQVIARGGEWFEISRRSTLAPGVDALLINRITEQQQAIATITQNSILLGLLGLLLSESLLWLVMQPLVRRLQRLADVLPLLAEDQFANLRNHLPTRDTVIPWRDEMDVMTDTVANVSECMERLQRDRVEAQAELVWLADHDPLTQLLNRRRFNQELAELVKQARIANHSGALLFFDLDQFKDVNDISGHPVGDLLLQRIAERLTELAAECCFLGRLGGDEFALVVAQADLAEAIALAEQVQMHIRSVVVHHHDLHYQVSASIGIVLFPEHGVEPEQLLAHADLAMYRAKEKGRRRWSVFAPEDQDREQADSRVRWSERIAVALAEERFELHFQPIMELATGSLHRMEALIRMRDEQGKLVYPNSFIPVAEKTGQIQAIDHWVLAESILTLQQYPDIKLSVNLSASALEDPALLSNMQNLLAQYEVDPARLTLEITETVAINRLEHATRLMHRIQELGCQFALDDFGSGFASYAYLRQLPMNSIKIDGAFIRNIVQNHEDRVFVRAVVEIAHSMGKRVVAEFVENAEILAVLHEIEVDYAQGYHIGRPAPLPNP
ncbi:MAG: hypothetical protein QG599_3759 [Pseudomonadota bacterium]|nr:hypothetical protein [Pseudomonadota bacterium]